MIIGSMTQYLAKVQRMPESALKTLEKLIRNFAWSGESKPTVSMQHLSNGISAGGKKVLDIYACNEAIQLTWIQSYLKLNKSRSTWALLADEILKCDIPGEPKTLVATPNAQINQFLQSWHSRINKKNTQDENDNHIPDDLREMLKIAKLDSKLSTRHRSSAQHFR